MAKGRVEASQLYAPGIFEEFIKGAGRSIETMEKLEGKFRDSLSVSKEFLQVWKAFDSKSIRELNAVMGDSAKVLKQLEALKKQQAQTEEALRRVMAANEKLERERIKTQRVKIQDDEKSAKAAKKKADEEKKLNSVYDQSVKRLSAIKKELKELEIREQGGTKAAKTLRQEYEKLNGSVRKAEQSVGEYQRNVGKYPGMGSMLGKGLGVLTAFTGVTVGLSAVGSAVQDAVKDFQEYDAKLKEVSAITGLAGKDLEFFAEKAKEAGMNTRTSAVDYLEAIKLIGGASPILLKNKEALAAVTDDAILLSEAAGIDLPTAAGAVTASLNQFNLKAGESKRVINALAAGSKEGSAEVSDLNEAFKNVGTVASDANISFEQTVALLETLAERQLKGAEAGTKLRGAISQLQKAGLGFASGKFNINDALKDAEKRLNAIQDPAKRARAQIKLFGVENQVAGSILLQNQKKFEDLTKAVTGTNTALEQAAINNSSAQAESERLNAKIKTLNIELGEKMLPVLNAVKAAWIGLLEVFFTGENLLTKTADRIQRMKEGWSDLQKQFPEIAKSLTDFSNKSVSDILKQESATANLSEAFFLLQESSEETKKEGYKLIEQWKSGKISVDDFYKSVYNLYILEGKRRQGFTGTAKELSEVAKLAGEVEEKMTKTGDGAGTGKATDPYADYIAYIERVRDAELTANLRTSSSEEEKGALKLEIEKQYLEKALDAAKTYGKNVEAAELALQLKKEEIYQRDIEAKRKTYEKLKEINKLSIGGIEDDREKEEAQANFEFWEKIESNKTDKSAEAHELRLAQYEEFKRKMAAIDQKYEDQASEEEAQMYANQLEYEKYAEDKKEADRKESYEKRKQALDEFSQQLLQAVENEIDRENQLKDEAIDREIDKRQSNIDRQRELAEKGLQNTLVFEEQQLAKAELEKARLAKKEIRDQEKITFLKLLQGYATEGKSSEAVRRALTDIALARVLNSFYDGTEDTGPGGTGIDNKGGFAAILHPKERVMTADQNEKMGSTPNEDVAEIVKAYNHGDLIPRHMAPTITVPGKSTESNYSGQLVTEMQSLRAEMQNVHRAIKNRPVSQSNLNSVGEWVETRIYNNKKEIITHARKKPKF